MLDELVLLKEWGKKLIAHIEDLFPHRDRDTINRRKANIEVDIKRLDNLQRRLWLMCSNRPPGTLRPKEIKRVVSLHRQIRRLNAQIIRERKELR